MREVPRNPAIRIPESTMTVLWVLVSLIVASGILVLLRRSTMAVRCLLFASGLGIFFARFSLRLMADFGLACGVRSASLIH